MGRRLILLRHGDAAWPSGGQSDLDRPLTAEGQRQADKIASSLVKLGWSPDRIVCSPAARAHATARVVLAAHQAPLDCTPILYDGGLRDIQDHVSHTEDVVSTLLLVGHNPTFSTLASALTGIRVSLGTANAALLTISDKSWSPAALLDAAWTLDQHLVPV